MALTTREHIASPAWKSGFLERLKTVPDIEDLFNASRPPNSEAYLEVSNKLHTFAHSLLSTYPKVELMVARQHYNALHLAEYWKTVRAMLNKGIDQGFIAENFPLVKATASPSTKQLLLSACTTDQFTLGFVNFNPDTMTVIARETVPSENSPRSPRQIVNSLLGKLVLLRRECIGTFTQHYNLYLSQQHAARSPIWDDYCIHIFLDTFLYFDGVRPQFRSNFDAIFFNDNLPELMAYIEYHHNAGNLLVISDVRDFLSRQTVHALKFSLKIHLPEAQVLNEHKELLAYNPGTDIVELQNIPQDMLESARAQIHEHGLIQTGGCPFAQAKGLNGNALVEVYDYFNTLFIAVLSSSWEFNALFSEP